MSVNSFSEKLSNYISDMLKHYEIDARKSAEGCQQKVNLVGTGKNGENLYFMIDISGELEDSANIITCQGKLIVVRYGITVVKFYQNAEVVDIRNLETIIRRTLGINSEKSAFEKTFIDYLKLQSPEPEALRSMLTELFNSIDAKLVENTLLKIYASGRNVVDRIEPGKKSSYTREKFIRVLEDLGLIFLSEITPGNSYSLSVYACTQQGIELAQKLAQETFMQKQSVVGLWLDRHDPGTCFLAIWAAMKGSIYQNYPVCAPIIRETTPRIVHIPCAVMGPSRCDRFINEEIPVELSLFADSILGSKNISEKIYSALYELTASYLAILARVQIGGNDAEGICIIPELAKSIYDATMPDFISKFASSDLLKSVNSYSAAVLLVGIDMGSNDAERIMNMYGVTKNDVSRAMEDLISSGAVERHSPTLYSAVNWDLLSKEYLEKIDAISAELEIF